MGSASLCVVGGGIVGLTTALTLQDRLPDALITIIAEKFNTETTSDGAAGLFYPFETFKTRSFEMARKILMDSYNYYNDLMTEEGEHISGVSTISGYILSNISQKEVQCPVIVGVVPDYRILTPEEVFQCPGSWNYGCYVRSLIINGRIFLPWALRRFQERGGKIDQRKISNFFDLIPHAFDVIVNCTGLGARELCNDMNLVPVRGQVFKVSAPWVKNFYLVDDSIYIIPGFETTLGGCKEYNRFNVNIEKEMSDHIWSKCTELMPSLKNCAVIREWVGLRPQRIPIRLETEKIRVEGHTLKIVHNYGHGSQGITVAPGCARYCVDYVLELLRDNGNTVG